MCTKQLGPVWSVWSGLKSIHNRQKYRVADTSYEVLTSEMLLDLGVIANSLAAQILFSFRLSTSVELKRSGQVNSMVW